MCNDSRNKMSEMKEKNGGTIKDRYKRPDKQLYVPRALRKVESEKSRCKSLKSPENPSRNNAEKSAAVNLSRNNAEKNAPENLSRNNAEKSAPVNPSSNNAEKNAPENPSSNNAEKNAPENPSSTNAEKSELPKSSSLSVLQELDTEKTIVQKCDDLKICEKYTNQFIDSVSDSSNKSKNHSSSTEDAIIKIDEKNCIITNADEIQEIAAEVNNDCFYRNGHDKITQCVLEEEHANCENILPACDIDNCDSSRLFKLEKCVEEGDKSINIDLFSKQSVIEGRCSDIQTDISVEDDSWENMFNDDGECLDPKLLEELSDITGRMEVTIAKNDYSSYQSLSKSLPEEFNNIVELFGFPVEFNTQDLTSAFSTFQEASYTIKWVDDCHALAIFSSPVIANQALCLNHPFIKVRPVSEGIKESKEKARFCSRFCEAPKPRPATTAALARRLVTGALGLKVHMSKEQRDLERNMLKEAREKKKLKAKRRQDIWDGIVS